MYDSTRYILNYLKNKRTYIHNDTDSNNQNFNISNISNISTTNININNRYITFRESQNTTSNDYSVNNNTVEGPEFSFSEFNKLFM